MPSWAKNDALAGPARVLNALGFPTYVATAWGP